MDDIFLKKYKEHRWSVKNRVDAQGNPIEFKLTFEQWKDIWINSGFWHLRGNKKGQYCMSRYNDIGHYEVGNVYIQPNAENTRQHNITYSHSKETKEKIRLKRAMQVIPRGSDNSKAKAIMTPAGKFDTIKDAGKYYNCTPENINYRLKKHSKEYYYL